MENIGKEKEASWGGKRDGAGRPGTGRSKVNFYITDHEKSLIKLFLDDLRNDLKPVSGSEVLKQYESCLKYAIAKQVGSPDRITRAEYHQAEILGQLIGIDSVKTMRRFIDKCRENEDKKTGEQLDKILK